MDSAEIVEHEVEHQRVNVVVELLRESVGQPGGPAHAHAHGEVLALDIGRGNVRHVGVALECGDWAVVGYSKSDRENRRLPAASSKVLGA